MDNGEKKASKILTTNDIREGARNWTLAGDVGLLAHLEKFSENITSRTQETQQHFTDLVDDYEELYIKVGNVTNQFLALQNCQFVENRVYDEETPTEEKAEVKVQNEVEQEKLLLMQYKEAVEVGIKLLDTHFQEVQLPPNSDSDDDDDDGDGDEVSTGNSVIWKPKNPYVGKKFPLLIGSAEWWADDLVGLGAEEDILDTDKIISESESDMESLKSVDKKMKSSSSSLEHIESIPTKPTFLDSSSDDLFGLDKNENLKRSASDDHFLQKNSLLNQPDSFLPDFEKEPETETGKRRDFSGDVQPVDEMQKTPPASQPKKVDNAFTRELMAKLSSVTNKKEVGVTEEKKGTEGKSPSAKANFDDNLFDETDDSSDLFSAKVNRTPEIPVEKKGLFFDGENDDELFRGESGLFSGSNFLGSNGLKKPEDQPIGGNILDASEESKKPPKMESIVAKKGLMGDLFDDLDDDDILFAAAKPESAKSDSKSLPSEESSALKKTKSDVAAGSTGVSDDGLFDGINAEMEDDFFSSSGVFAANKNKTTNSKALAESSSKRTHLDLFPEESQERRKTESPFEDLSKKGTFTWNSSAADVKRPNENPFIEPSGKKTSILDSEDDGDGDGDGDDDDADDDDADDDDDDLFSKGVREKKLALKAPAFLDDEDTALFVEKPKPPDSVSVSSSRSSLFDDMSASKSRLASVFEKDKSSNKTEDDLFSLPEDSLFGEDAKTSPGKDLFSAKVRGKEKNSLFDDCDDGDDLFAAGKGSGGEKWSGNLLKSKGDALEEAEKQGGSKTKVKTFVDHFGNDDLFKTPATSTALRETKSKIIRQSEAKLFADDLDDAELFSSKPAVTKPKPPDSLSLKATESEVKGSTVGKLSIPDNLKVRFELAAKRISPGGVRPSLEEKASDEDKKDEVLDEAPRSSNLLKCPSKDRVKIPGRRRPQSRRARQEAIRNSGVWDQPNSPSSSVNTPHPSGDSLPSPVVSNPLSPSTDEEDFFKVPELDTNFEKEDQSIFKSDLFESSKSSKPDESLLFDGAPVLSPLSSRRAEEPAKKPGAELLSASEKPKSESIFDDDNDLNDHDNLFKTVKPLSGQFAAKTEEKVKKMLFEQDSDSDEDDLFGGRSEAAPPKPAPVSKPKEESEGKGKGSSTFVDPLGLITND